MTKKARVSTVFGVPTENLKGSTFPYLPALARQAACEGAVLLRNRDRTLPLAGKTVSLFGRTAVDYVKSGTGSGGLVNVDYAVNILDGLREKKNIRLNEELVEIYDAWRKENPFDEGHGWGTEPWAQKEMPVSEEVAARAAAVSDAAVVVFGRTAGEDRDNSETAGSFCPSAEELQVLDVVRRHFDRMVVVLNVGNIVSGEFSEQCDALLYVWQGGQEGGRAVADLLTGDANPCGKLADTVARGISDYPAWKSFGSEEANVYAEDIYVGYRYFETFHPEAVLFPFGFGLSYTTFSVSGTEAEFSEAGVTVRATVKNTGEVAGKEVLQVYVAAPQGLLGKPRRELKAFAKTRLLGPGEEETLSMYVSFASMASYDDAGKTGFRSAYVLEAGNYEILLGTDVRTVSLAAEYRVAKTYAVEQCTEALAPIENYERMIPVQNADGTFSIGYEQVPHRTYDIYERAMNDRPHAPAYTGDMGYRFCDYLDGRVSLEAFLAQLTDFELATLLRGEGMNSQKVTPGTGCAFGGLTPAHRHYGIPVACGTDGPSGIRLDSGAHATSIPNGTALACTFNCALIERLYEGLSVEMVAYNIDFLLGPGINIHRHPLNGRNFEYFSEDPYLAGKMASATNRGIAKSGSGATIKHFTANSQELTRRWTDSIASERAYREIYLKPFEIAVKDGAVRSIMTSYNRVNGNHAPINHDLNTTILRGEWGYTGFVMTDWWPDLDDFHTEENAKLDLASCVRAQNDVYMVCTDTLLIDSTVPDALADGTLTRGQLYRCAANVCRVLAGCNASVRDDCRGKEEETVGDGEVIFSLDAPEMGKPYEVTLPKDGEYVLTVETDTVSVGTAQNQVDLSVKDHTVRFTVGGANAGFDKKRVTLRGGDCTCTLTWEAGQIRVTGLTVSVL